MNQNSAFMQFIPLAAIMLIFYFLLIRPQQKQLKERKKMLEAIKPAIRYLPTAALLEPSARFVKKSWNLKLQRESK